MPGKMDQLLELFFMDLEIEIRQLWSVMFGLPEGTYGNSSAPNENSGF